MASPSSVSLFTKTARLDEAICVINKIDDSKFPLLISRILQKLHLKDEENFNEEEEEKLQISFSMDKDEIRLVLETLSFILEQAAYYSSKPAVLSHHLEEIGLGEEKRDSMVQSWTANAKTVTEKLRQRTITPVQLKDIGWELRLQLGQSSLSKLNQTCGVIQLGLTTDNKTAGKLNFEFTHDQLYTFYNQIETIQSQLDSLR